MNQENPIDELFRRKLGQSEAPVPDDMWSRIAAARQPEKKHRRPLPLWLWSTLVLIGVAIIALGLGLTLVGDAKEALVRLDAFTIEAGTDIPLVAIGEEPDVANSLAIAVETNVSAAAVEPATSASVTTSNSTHGVDKPVSKFTPKPEPVVAALNLESSDPAIALAPITSDIALFPVLPSIETDRSGLESTIEGTNTTTTLEEEEEETPVFGPHRRRQNEIVDILPTENFVQIPEDLTAYLLPVSRAPKCANFSSNFLHFDLEILGGPGYAHQQLSARNPESVAHLNRRLETETSRLSYSGGLRLSAISRKGIGLRMGLGYNQINERFEYMTENHRDIRQVIDANGNVIRVDTIFIGPQLASVHNRLRMIEVPLLLTYETQFRKLRLGFNVGAAFNLWFDANGMIASPSSGDPIPFGQVGESDVLPIFDTQASAAILGSMTIAYNLHNRWSVIAEPYLRSHPQAFSNQAYDLQQNYWQTGLQLGLRMRL